jgi:hypothetical protein
MGRVFDFFIEDGTENYKAGMPPFTTLLGEEFYPNSFWFDKGGILIRTNENFDEIKTKINIIAGKKVYHNFHPIRYRILCADEITFNHPDDETKIEGAKAFDFFVKYYYDKIGVLIDGNPKETQLKLF